METHNKTTCIYSIDDLIAERTDYPEIFKHLHIFLQGLEESDVKSNSEFLMVSSNVLSKVQIVDLSVENDKVVLEFIDCKSQEVGRVRIDVNDTKSSVLFIRWSDIKKMVLEECTDNISDEKLLEFEY